MKYKLAIFDFDGTLADSFPFFLGTVNTLAVKYKFRKIDESETETLRGHGARKIMHYVGLPLWKVPMVAASFKKMMAEKIDQIPMFAGVSGMIRELSDNGIIVSLVTSNSHENVCRILGKENLHSMKHPQCNISLFGKRAALRRILQSVSIDHRNTIYIGDEIRDLEAAQAERIPFGAVAWGYTRMDALLKHDPAERFNTVDEVREKLTSLE